MWAGEEDSRKKGVKEPAHILFKKARNENRHNNIQQQEKEGIMRKMKARKAMYCVALMAAVVALLVMSVPLRASETDDRIESTARQSYVFKTYRRG